MTAFIAESRNALCDARTIKTVDDAKLAAVTIGVTWALGVDGDSGSIARANSTRTVLSLASVRWIELCAALTGDI